MKRIILSFFLFSVTAGISRAQTKSQDTLLRGFVTPGNAAKPRVWWHWMNGNITKDGIKKDLLWMKRSGIGGMQAFDAQVFSPQIVKERLTYMTPAWKDAFKYATHLADSLKLELAVAGSPGWSESGGPWVSPENGMKKFVWSETRVAGGKQINLTVPMPPALTGAFQNLPFVPDMTAPRGQVVPQYYHDVFVIAYKLPSAGNFSQPKPVVTSSKGSFTLEQLTDGDLLKTNLLPRDSSGYAWIQFTFDQPQTIRGITVVGGGVINPAAPNEVKENRFLQASNDGKVFYTVASLPIGTLTQQTAAIPVTTATCFRVVFKNPVAQMSSFGGMGSTPPGTQVAEIILHQNAVVNRFEEKAGFANANDLYQHPTIESNNDIQPGDIIDVTAKMDKDGVLNWSAPAGEWNIIRLGYSLTGITNHPATPEATGLEVDKMDPVAVRGYFEHYLDMYKDATGGLMGAKGLQYMVTDSYEAGIQNWTPNLPAEFARRRGYSLIPWIPVLTGHVVKSAEASDQFLWDFRKTLGELLVENHYDLLTKILRERGMKRYSESHEDGRDFVGDGMEVKRTAAIPMSAMWVPTPRRVTFKYRSDIRESASVAHIYGQNIAAAESFTTNGLQGNAWSYSPENLKPTADLELAMGLNRFVVHTSVHQSTDDKIPGLSLGPFGQWFNRHDAWAEQAKAWTDYLSRSSYLLQQGKFVADVIYYYGEDNNITALFDKKLPDVPEGYNYDFVNADALVNVLSVKNGSIVTPSGMTYKVLALDSNSRQMTLKVLKKIDQLVRAGATIVGPRPTGTPSLSDNQEEYNKLLSTLWTVNGGVQKVGLGTIISNQDIASALKTININPDFAVVKSDPAAEILYVHRKLKYREIYWVSNHSNLVEDLKCDFRITGKAVQLWHAETGEVEPISYSFENGRTQVALHLNPDDAVFLVFNGAQKTVGKVVPSPVRNELLSITGPWTVNFQKNLGAPDQASFETLGSWTDNADNGIKYFSGTATYSKQVKAEAQWFKRGAKIWLDLGEVKNIAEVVINGKSCGTVWRNPFRVNLTSSLKPGNNTIQIKVTNLWVNRLIGDQQPSAQKYTYTGTFTYYNAKSPLLPSGLLGPVRLVEESNQ